MRAQRINRMKAVIAVSRNIARIVAESGTDIQLVAGPVGRGVIAIITHHFSK